MAALVSPWLQRKLQQRLLIAEKHWRLIRGVNSSVSEPQQGVGMMDCQRLEGYKTREVDITELCCGRNELRCGGPAAAVTETAVQK